MNVQRRGPPFKHHAQGVVWELSDRPSLWRANWREIVGTAALVAGLVGAVVMGFIAMGVVS